MGEGLCGEVSIGAHLLTLTERKNGGPHRGAAVFIESVKK
jgi:hypothetical protein